ncbi:MAG: Major facilitator superfamily 1 [Frankiales bacterium]|nr:Major facilitator superfamily 1 [Frankiales bacterium]
MELVRPAARRLRKAARADGAGSSGLSALLGVHALQSAGDALVAVALAGTLFFSVPLGQARGRVALYLVLTLLPFSFLVPIAGPLLDRFRHGRRNVLAATAGGRGLLTWVMAGAIAGLGLYPLALGVLVLARAYGVARSAATPRVRPEGMGLVQANARLNIAGTASSSAAAAVGAVVAKTLGASWVLYAASLLLLAAGVLALRLPSRVDEAPADPAERSAPFLLRDSGPVVLGALSSAAALRSVSGLLTVFLAFLLRATHASAWDVALVVGAAAVGQIGGTIGAARIRISVRALTRLSPLLAGLACLAAAVRPHGVLPAVAAGVASFVASMSKFGLDASLQTEVPARSVSSAFARSETALQLTWVFGAAIALVLPASGSVGFAIAAVLSAVGAVAALRPRR